MYEIDSNSGKIVFVKGVILVLSIKIGSGNNRLLQIGTKVTTFQRWSHQ